MAHPIWENILGVGYALMATLIQGRKGEESRHVACLLLFVKFWNKLLLMCNLCKKVVIELLWAINNIIFAPYHMYIATDGS